MESSSASSVASLDLALPFSLRVGVDERERLAVLVVFLTLPDARDVGREGVLLVLPDESPCTPMASMLVGI